MIIQDNEWHDGVLIYLKSETGFALRNSLMEFQEEHPDFLEITTGAYEPLKYNWNKGQPIMRIKGRDEEYTIIDMSVVTITP